MGKEGESQILYQDPLEQIDEQENELKIVDEETLKKFEQSFVLSNFKYNVNEKNIYPNVVSDYFPWMSREFFSARHIKAHG